MAYLEKANYMGLKLTDQIFIIVLEELSREIRSGCSEELLFADDLTLVGAKLDGLKGRQEAWKGAESKALRVNVKKKICWKNCLKGWKGWKSKETSFDVLFPQRVRQ